MTRSGLVMVACVVLVFRTAPARAYDLRLLGGADFLLTTGPSVSGVEDAELGLTLHADLREVAHRFDFRLDFMGREGFIGNATYNNLYELYGVARRIGGILDITVGRFRVPGGFWLIADGAMLSVRYTSWLSQSFYGGLRAFTTGRRNTWMTDDSPKALPLVGTSLLANHRLITGSLSFSYAQDDILLPEGLNPLTNQNITEHHFADEFFLAGQVTVYPHATLFVAAGASLGTRYDVQFNAANPLSVTTLGVATLGAYNVYASAEWRPRKRLGFLYTFNFEHVRLLQSQLLTLTAQGTPVQAADGSFEDHQLRVTYLPWRALRLEATYRLRFRANTDVEHHLLVGARGDDLWRGLGGFASVGIDVDHGIDLPGATPAVRKVHERIIYSAGVSYVRSHFDGRVGITFTDGIGSGLGFSQHAMNESTGAPTELFPYVLETNRVGFVRVFALFWKLFAGADVEENLDLAQLRMLVQVGGWL
jgi:hypothetical protein